jgi:hypothetical protein
MRRLLLRGERARKTVGAAAGERGANVVQRGGAKLHAQNFMHKFYAPTSGTNFKHPAAQRIVQNARGPDGKRLLSSVSTAC